MPKKIFSSPEEEKQWRENRPAYLKAYNKAYKESAEYGEWQKNYRSSPEFQKRHKKYMRRYNKRKPVKAKKRTPEYKKRQHDNYLIRKKQGLAPIYNPEYYKDQNVKDRRNQLKRDKRKKERIKTQKKRERMLAKMTPRELKKFLANEKRERSKKIKATRRKNKKLKENAVTKKQHGIIILQKLTEKGIRKEWLARLEQCIQKVKLLRFERAQRIKLEKDNYLSVIETHVHEMKILSALEVEQVKKNHRELKRDAA